MQELCCTYPYPFPKKLEQYIQTNDRLRLMRCPLKKGGRPVPFWHCDFEYNYQDREMKRGCRHLQRKNKWVKNWREWICSKSELALVQMPFHKILLAQEEFSRRTSYKSLRKTASQKSHCELCNRESSDALDINHKIPWRFLVTLSKDWQLFLVTSEENYNFLCPSCHKDWDMAFNEIIKPYDFFDLWDKFESSVPQEGCVDKFIEEIGLVSKIKRTRAEKGKGYCPLCEKLVHRMNWHHCFPLEIQNQVFPRLLAKEGNITVGLCPTCHRKVHHILRDRKQEFISLCSGLRTVRKKIGKEIRLEDVKGLYGKLGISLLWSKEIKKLKL